MPAALLAALALQATPETLAELEQAYDQSCNSRVYGQFDGLCSDMAERLKSYRAELRRRPKPRPGPAADTVAAASPTPPPEPPPAHEPLAPAGPPKR